MDSNNNYFIPLDEYNGSAYPTSSQGSTASAHFDVTEEDEIQHEEETKVINDVVHGHIELPTLIMKFIDTPQFQRLRFIKQLGATDLVYPGAVHTRFAHCIGTCHLAGKLIKHLQRKQSELNITTRDVLCVQLAGLLHDVGHGPYSHLYDGPFLSYFNKDWHHEIGSTMMIDHMIEVNALHIVMEEYGLIYKQDIQFIKEAINPLPIDQCMKDGIWQYEGRPQEKSFMYEIVSNERNKVDVDKWDYFARDCHYLGIKSGFDHNRFIEFTKVLQLKPGPNITPEDALKQICVRDKMHDDLYELFHTRRLLHFKAYQHRVTKAAEVMITDAMILANDHLLMEGSDQKMLKLSECCDDPVAFEKLTDNIFTQILFSDSNRQQMLKAKQILQRIMSRDLYKCCGEIKLDRFELIDFNKQKHALHKEIIDHGRDLKFDDIEIKIRKIDYGMGSKNPIKKYLFYSKKDPSRPYVQRNDQLSHMHPQDFQDRDLQIFCKDLSKQEIVTETFSSWCKIKQFKFYKSKKSSVIQNLTPLKRKASPTEPSNSKLSHAKRKLCGLS